MNEFELACIEQQCAKLINRFSNLNDAMRYEELAALFTEDARFARPTDPDNFIAGREAILAAFQARPRDKVTRHIISNIDVEVLDPARARSLSYALLYTGSPDTPAKLGLQANAVQLVGEFHDEFVKTPDGWKFSSRQGRIIFST